MKEVFLICICISFACCTSLNCNQGTVIDTYRSAQCEEECYLHDFGSASKTCSNGVTKIYQYNITSSPLIESEFGRWFQSYSFEKKQFVTKYVVAKGECTYSVDRDNGRILMESKGEMTIFYKNEIIKETNKAIIKIQNGCNNYQIICNQAMINIILCRSYKTNCNEYTFYKYLPIMISNYLCDHVYITIMTMTIFLLLIWLGLFRYANIILTNLYIVTKTIIITLFFKKIPKCNVCGLTKHGDECNSHCYCGEQMSNSRSLKLHLEKCKKKKISVIYQSQKKISLIPIVCLKMVTILILLSLITMANGQDINKFVESEVITTAISMNINNTRDISNNSNYFFFTICILTITIFIKNIIFYQIQIHNLDIIVNNRRLLSRYLMKFPILSAFYCNWCSMAHETKITDHKDCLGICNCEIEIGSNHKFNNECFAIKKYVRTVGNMNILEISILLLIISLSFIGGSMATCDIKFRNTVFNDKCDILAKEISMEVIETLICKNLEEISNTTCTKINNMYSECCSEYKQSMLMFDNCKTGEPFNTMTLSKSVIQYNRCKPYSENMIGLDNKNMIIDFDFTEKVSETIEMELSSELEKSIYHMKESSTHTTIPLKQEFLIDGVYKDKILFKLKSRKGSCATIKSNFDTDMHESIEFTMCINNIYKQNIYKIAYKTGPTVSITNDNHELCRGECPKFELKKGFLKYSKEQTSQINCETIGCFAFNDGCVYGQCRDEIDFKYGAYKKTFLKDNLIIEICLIERSELKCFKIKNKQGIVNNIFEISTPDYTDGAPTMIIFDTVSSIFRTGPINMPNIHENICGTPQFLGKEASFDENINLEVKCNFISGKKVNIHSCFKNTNHLCKTLSKFEGLMFPHKDGYEVLIPLISDNDIEISLYTNQIKSFDLNTKIKNGNVKSLISSYHDGSLLLKITLSNKGKITILTSCSPGRIERYINTLVKEIKVDVDCDISNQNWVYSDNINTSIVIEESKKHLKDTILETEDEIKTYDRLSCLTNMDCSDKQLLDELGHYIAYILSIIRREFVKIAMISLVIMVLVIIFIFNRKSKNLKIYMKDNNLETSKRWKTYKKRF